MQLDGITSAVTHALYRSNLDRSAFLVLRLSGVANVPADRQSIGAHGFEIAILNLDLPQGRPA